MHCSMPAACLISEFERVVDQEKQGPYELSFRGQALQPTKTLAEQGMPASESHYVIMATSLKIGMVQAAV